YLIVSANWQLDPVVTALRGCRHRNGRAILNIADVRAVVSERASGQIDSVHADIKLVGTPPWKFEAKLLTTEELACLLGVMALEDTVALQERSGAEMHVGGALSSASIPTVPNQARA